MFHFDSGGRKKRAPTATLGYKTGNVLQVQSFGQLGKCCEKCGSMGCFVSDFLTFLLHVNSGTTIFGRRPQVISSYTVISMSSRVELVRQKMAGSIGHRREKEMKCEQIAKYIKIYNIYKKFSLHSEPAEVDEVAQMRFPPVLVFSSIHLNSIIFVATTGNQFLFPTVRRTSGIAMPRRSPS